MVRGYTDEIITNLYNQPMSFDELFKEHLDFEKSLFSYKLNLLVENGFVNEKDHRYCLSNKTLELIEHYGLEELLTGDD